MIRGFLAFFLFIAPAFSQNEQTQLDSSPAVFSVLAAINVAGYDAELDSPANSPVRQAVRAAILAEKPPVLADLKSYFAAHRQRDWTADLSQYISFALSVEGPPDFRYRYKQDELPPDVVPLDGFQRLLVDFYKQAKLDQLWRKYQPAYEEAIARYHLPAMDALMRVNAYLRSSTSPALGSRFQVYVDLLGAPNQIQTRSYKNDYFIVVTPSAEPQADDIRHGYLHFQLDPLALRYAAELNKKKALLDFAQPAPLLGPQFKSDFLLLAGESLIKAVESRLAPAASRQAMVDEAFREGFIVTPAFAEALPAYEKQEQSLRFFYPELVNAIDLRREDERLRNVQFATAAPVRKAKPVAVERKAEPSGAAKTLDEAERAYAARDLENAKAAYSEVLKQSGSGPFQAAAYYGLARIAALQRDPEGAQKLFEKTLESSPEPQVQAWAHVYLGRLADAAGDRQQATTHYRAALDTAGATAAAREAAQKGLQQAFQKTQP